MGLLDKFFNAGFDRMEGKLDEMERELDKAVAIAEEVMKKPSKSSGIPATVECPIEGCLKTFKVKNYEDFLPPHTDAMGRKCLYEGPGSPLSMDL